MELVDWCLITRGERITIPKKVRKMLKISKGDAVGFYKEGDKVIFTPVDVEITKEKLEV